jgi:Flp pilus assembly protein TadD
MSVDRQSNLSGLRRIGMSVGLGIGLVFGMLAIGCESTGSDRTDWFEGGEELPPSEETLRITARILAAKGDFVQAGVAVERMLYQFPGQVGTYTEGAEVLLQQGRVQDAIDILDQGLVRLPGDPVLLNDRGLCHLLATDLISATRDFEAALAWDPRDSDYVANVALVKALAGDEKTARALWSRVLPPRDVAENLKIAAAARPNFKQDGYSTSVEEITSP